MNFDFGNITKNWKTALCLGIIVFLLDIFWLKEIINIIYPIGDEFSLIVESQRNVSSWLLSGYSNYFNVYEEYFTPYTNFVRPVANIIYKVFAYTQNPMVYQLIIINYVAHSLLCVILYSFSISLNNNNKFSFFIALAGFLAPAFWLTPMIESPSFSLDGVATVMSLVSLMALIRGNHFTGILFLIFGIFTKETALPIIIVWITFGLLRKTPIIVLLGCSTLALWLFVRMFAFNTLIGGTYSFNEFSVKSLIFRATSLTTLPLGNFSVETLKELMLFKKVTWAQLFFFISNCVIWIFSILFFFRARSLIFKATESVKYNGNFIIIVLAFMFSVSYYTFVGGDVRFSYLPYVLWLIIVCGMNNFKPKNIILFIFICSAGVSFLSKSSKVTDIDKYYYQQSRALVEFLQQHEISGKVYVVNDFISRYARQEYIAIYSGSTSNLLRGSSISLGTCKVSDLNQISTTVVVDSIGAKDIQVHLPSCASFIFEGASVKKMLENIEGISLHRNDDISYRFNKLEITKTKFGGNNQINFGDQMGIYLRPEVHVLYFDFRYDKWILLD